MKVKTSTKLAVASAMCRSLLFARRLVGLGSTAEVTRDGIRWNLDLTEGIDLAIYLLGRFEVKSVRVFRRLIRPGDVVVDIGANIGANALEMARCVGPGGRVIAFEPTSFAVSRMRRNLELNPDLAQRVTLEQAILGDGRPAVRESFYSSWPLLPGAKDGIHSRHGGRLTSAADASSWTLDDYLVAEDVSNVRLVKLDVDGSEWSVLVGARQSLTRWRPFIVMEIAPYVLDEEAGVFEGVVGVLRDCGYRLSDIATGDALPLAADELRAIIPYGSAVNVLAEAERDDAVKRT